MSTRQETGTQSDTETDRCAAGWYRQVCAAATLPHLEDLSIGVQDVDGDFDVLLNALPSSLEVASLQRQVQVVTDVTWDADGRVNTPTHRRNFTASSVHKHTHTHTHTHS